MNRAFVTGGSGFVGSNLLRRLQQEGVETYALSRSKDSDKIIINLGATPVRGDLHNKGSLTQGMRGVDTVFHLAASVDFWKPASALWHDHVDGTMNVLASAKENHVKSFVYLGASSVIMNGKPIMNANEDFKSNNIIDGYSQTKLIAEGEILRANSKTLRTISIRPPMIWGRESHTLARIKDAAEAGRLRFINGGVHQFVTCHVKNVVEALMLAAKSDVGGKPYFVTDGEHLEFKQFIKALLRTENVEVKDKTIPLRAARFVAFVMASAWRIFKLNGTPPLYPGMVNITGLPFTISDERARRELGYRPVITVAEGLNGSVGV